MSQDNRPETLWNVAGVALRVTTLLVVLAIVSGCNLNVRPQPVAPEPKETRQFKDSLELNISTINVSGKLKLSSRFSTAFTAEKFRKILEQTLLEHHLLDRTGSYKLDVKLIKLHKEKSDRLIEPYPIFTSAIRYTLRDKTRNTTLYDKTIVSSYRATTKDSKMHERKLRIAINKTVTRSLEAFLDGLSELSPDSTTHQTVDLENPEHKRIPQPKRLGVNILEVIGILFVLILSGVP